MKNIALKKSKDIKNISNISAYIEKITKLFQKTLNFINYFKIKPLVIFSN